VKLKKGADPDFAGVALDPLCDAGLDAARNLGVTYAEVRVERIRSQLVALRDGKVVTTVDDTGLGAGVRVVKNGSLGFAATVELTTDAMRNLAEDASSIADATSSALAIPVGLASEPAHGPVLWSSEYEIDPTEVPLSEKVGVLEGWSSRLLRARGVDHVEVALLAVTEDKHFANTDGTVTTQRRVRIRPVFEAFAVDAETGAFESMRSIAPPVGRGWEYVVGVAGGGNGRGDGSADRSGNGSADRSGNGSFSTSGSDSASDANWALAPRGAWDWERELEEVPQLLEEKMKAPSVDAGIYDLVVDPSNLWLTIHESIGHATELDRALGYEAAYAGTSFATLDKLGTLRYGSPHMHVTGDRTVPGGLATVRFDDEGVETQDFDIVRDGVLVGYQLDRRMASENGLGRSNGCAFADSPMHVPIQRMANVSLRPAEGEGPTTEELVAGVDRGIYVVGDKSWSIDMQRYNFQFTGQRFYLISGGRLAGQLKDVAYQSRTTDFWGSLEAVGGRSTYVLGGAFNCGKGQPGQVAPVSHGCPSALFRGVNILNTRSEAGAPG
jgi:TldD protein